MGISLLGDVQAKFNNITAINKTSGRTESKRQCKECNAKLSGNAGATTLRYHLRIHEREDEERRKKARNQQHMDEPFSPTPSTMTTTQKKKEEFIQAALNWITQDYDPFSTFDSSAFREFLAVIDPDVKPVCAKTIRMRLPDFRAHIERQINTLLQKTFKFGSITVDDWTSTSGRPFMSMTLHWLDSEFKAHEHALDLVPHPYPHDGVSIGKLI
ncbi:hypothetical protein BGX27_003468, partial [Mortierella sp. AM989]